MRVLRPTPDRFDEALALLRAADTAVYGDSDWTASELREDWERLDRWPSAARTSRLVCIGRDLDQAELEHSLCALALEDRSDGPDAFADLGAGAR